jgi:hypothetical protein
MNILIRVEEMTQPLSLIRIATRDSNRVVRRTAPIARARRSGASLGRVATSFLRSSSWFATDTTPRTGAVGQTLTIYYFAIYAFTKVIIGCG